MHTKVQKMCDVTRARVAGLMLGILLALTGTTAGAMTFYAPDRTPCTEGAVLTEPGVVQCATGTLTLQFSCSGETVIDSQGTITCPPASVATAPVCTLTAAPTSIAPGASSILTANCPTATSYIWTGGTCAGKTTSTCTVTPASTTTYTVKGINAAGTSATAASATVTVSAKPVCTLTASPASITSGASSTLTASCPTATSYTWTGGTCAGKTTSTCTVTPASTTSYTVKGTSTAGTGAAASATVTVTASSSSTVPNCTLGQMAVGGMISLSANCTPAATSYAWSANTGFASSSAGGLIAKPTVTTTYSVKGTNAAGAGNTATLTITVTTPTPTCTLTANPAAIDQNGSSTLTASCSPAPTSYIWTGGTCAGNTTSTCTVTPAANTVTTYTVKGTNTSGTGNTASATVTVAPPTCTLSAAPSSIAPGGSSILTASCSPAATAGYVWTGGTCGAVTINTCNTGVLNGTTSYTVTGSNTLGMSNPPASATVAVLPPTCTLSAVPSTIAPGSTSTLTASCSPAADSYVWTGIWTGGAGGTCVGSATSCTVTGGNTVGATTYTVIGHNLAGNSVLASATVTVAKPTCTLSAAPSSVVPGGSTILTASCSPLAGISYIWTGGTCAGSAATCNQTLAVAGSTIYTVTGTNAAGTSTAASATVTATATQCTIAAANWPGGLQAWPGGTPLHTINPGEMQAYSKLLPSDSGSFTRLAYSSCRTEFSISAIPCEWSATLVANACQKIGLDPTIYKSTTDFPASPGYCRLQPNTTYYLNVRQAGVATPGCRYYLEY